jgi:hypothetical protein
VSFRLAATAGLPVLEPGGDQPLDAVFVSRARLDDWLEDVPPARHRFVVGDAVDGYRDYLTEVSGYTDSLPGYAPVRGGAAASADGTSFREWGRLAQEMAQVIGLGPGERVLVDAAEHEHPVKWLLAPLAVGGSVVLCANLDPATVADRAAAERVTRVL